ncbi:MAG: FliG C-terminal domain-containing protein [Sandaracinaceae bacterium]
MSRDNLKGLLDDMLEESATQIEAEATREREALETRKAAPAPAPKEVAALEAIDALTGLTQEDLQKVLGGAAPDDLLVVLATADDVLQRRILGNLSQESVQWVRQNLEHMDHVTDAERDGARAKVLRVANALLADGEISAPEPEAIGADEAPGAQEKGLRDLLTDLVRIAEQSGTGALEQLASSAGEPLLAHGLTLVAEGKKGDALRAELATRRAELERRYAQRLEWMGEALVAIAEGEGAEAFRARLFEA